MYIVRKRAMGEMIGAMAPMAPKNQTLFYFSLKKSLVLLIELENIKNG